MSPAPLLHPKTETTANKAQPHLKITRDSHSIRKPSPPLSNKAQQQRQPVIIYTHSPRVIHTNPRDFMALVQKLTGFSPARDEGHGKPPQQQLQQPKRERKEAPVCKEEYETSSCLTEDEEMNSCIRFAAGAAPLMEPPMIPNYVNRMEVYGGNSAELLCSNHDSSILNYAADQMFL